MRHQPSQQEQQLAVVRRALQKAKLSIQQSSTNKQRQVASASTLVNNASSSSSDLLMSPAMAGCVFGHFGLNACSSGAIVAAHSSSSPSHHGTNNAKKASPLSTVVASSSSSGLYLGMRTSQLRPIALDAPGPLPQEMRLVSLKPNAVCRLVGCHHRMYADMYVGELYTYVPNMLFVNANVASFVTAKFSVEPFKVVTPPSPALSVSSADALHKQQTSKKEGQPSSSPSSSPSPPPSQSLALMIAMDANDADDIARKKSELNLPATPAQSSSSSSPIPTTTASCSTPDKYIWLANRSDSLHLLREGVDATSFAGRPVLISFADIANLLGARTVGDPAARQWRESNLAALFSQTKKAKVSLLNMPPAKLLDKIEAGELGLVSGMYIGRDALDLQTRLLLKQDEEDNNGHEYVPVTLKCADALPVDYAFMRLLERWDDNGDRAVVQIKTKAFFRVVSWPSERAEKDLICVVPQKRGGKETMKECNNDTLRGHTHTILTYVSEGGFINRAALQEQKEKEPESTPPPPPSSSSSSANPPAWLYLPTFSDVVAFLQDPHGCIRRRETMEISDADMKTLLFTLYKGDFYVAQHVEIDVDVLDDEQELVSADSVDMLMRACELLTAECKSAIASDIAAGPAQGEAAFDAFVGKANDILATNTMLATSL